MFAYVWGDLLVVDLRLQFGWCGSPGWFGLVAGGIEHAQGNTTLDTAVRTLSGVKAVPETCKLPPLGKGREQAYGILCG